MDNYQKELKSKQNKRYREKKKAAKIRMSNLTEIHKSVITSMVMSGVDKFIGDTDHTAELSETLVESEGPKLATFSDKDFEKFVAGVKMDNATDRQGGKNVATYVNTVKELKAAEEAVLKAVRVRDQLQANKKSLLAQISDKAIKVMQVAHAESKLQEQNSRKRKALDGSQPEEETTTTSSGGWSFFGGAAGGATTGKK